MNYENKGSSRNDDTTANLDPITGAPGAHPIGTGVGAAAGGVAAGAVAGSVVGPVGTLVGAAVGAILGGLAGKGVAETIDPTTETAYWRDNYKDRPYVENATSFDEYGPAYDYGVRSYVKHSDRNFDDVEADLARDWNGERGESKLEWAQARNATRDAWERIGNR